MDLSPFGLYLIIINIIGFLAYGINTWLYHHTPDGQIDVVLTIISLLGGSLGIVVFIVLFDRKAQKENMMSRVFISCIFVIQVVIFLVLRGHFSDKISLEFWSYFLENELLIVYLGVINLITFAAFAVDKISAIEHKSRIRIVTLLGLAFIGGSIGALFAMYLLRHKTKKDYFTVGVPLIVLMQVVLLFYAMNAAW